MNQALHGPGTIEVALGAVLGLTLGAVVAAAYLVLKPVVVVTQMPTERSLTSVYYQPGSANKAKSTDWPAKQNQFIAGTTVQVTEDELNAWSLAGGTPPRNAKAKPVEAGQSSGGPQPATATKKELPVTDTFLTTKVPNFRIVGDALQIGWRCTLNAFGLTREVALVATGHFETSGAQVSFVSDKVFLGSCPLHWLPGASSELLAYVFKNQKTPDNIRLAWAKCTAASVVDGGLKLVQP